MSVKLIFDLPSEGGLVQRSRSFTGFSSLTGQRWPSSGRNAVRSKPLVAAKSPSWATESMSKQPPEQVDRIFRALRNGLKEYLEVHQAEMDFLSSQQRETKRNSRLAFLYDLEKEIRALERYIRRLEFHISKVEELYETYCIHWRLCQGAVNMKKAFSNSQSSRASRDSLLELSRSHRHSLQDMSSMAGELEMLLGELHIKMKGLIGFARLCPGDHYEVVVRLGRQHWRMKGRIQSDDTQLWEEEEMVFLPHIHHNFEIKVTEVKGLSRLLVGMVTCASADFFVARPQLMLVDVSELGTIKLQLEVTWNPFDSVSGERTRAVSPRRRSSSYSKISTASPSFTEKYYIAMVRQLRDPKGSLTSLVSRPRPSRGEVSLLSYLSDPTHIPANSLDCSGSHVGNAHDHLRPSTSYGSSPSPGTSLGGSQSQLEAPSEEKGEGVNEASSMPEESRYSLLPPERSSTPDILRKNPVGEPECAKLPGLGWSSAPGREPVRVQGSTEGNPAPPPAPAGAPGRSEVTETQCRVQTLRLGVLMVELENLLHNQEDPDKELRVLGNKIHHLATILKNDLSVLKKPTFTETLAVEKVLESFDFLSHDMNAEDDTSCMGSVRLKDTVCFQENTVKNLGLLFNSSQSEEELPITPLTSGNTSLDQALEIHLDICSILIEAVGAVDFSLSRRCLLEETSLQQDVLDAVSHLMLESDNAMSTTDLLPKIPGRKELSSFWDQCVADGNPPFCCHADSFSRALRKRYTHKVKAKQPGQSERVFRELLEQIQGCWRGVPYPRSVSNPERVTLFQLSVYLKRWEIQDLGEHISRLAKEIYILSALRSSKRRRALKKLKGRVFTELLPLRVTLETLAALHTDSSLKVCHAATRCLARASVCKAFRNKAVVFYTESLKLNDVKIRQASCLALKSLRATESVEQIAEMWRSEDDDVRSAARETVLSFGKKGYSGFQKMDQLHMEMQEETYQNQYTQITVL